MENKKKPSILELVPSHHDQEFSSQGVPFQLEMLEWPIFLHSGKEMDVTLLTIYRNALVALTTIFPFTAKISMGVNLKEKRLYRTKRTWGKIYLNANSILTFSHDTRLDNRPFYTLIEWPEFHNHSYSSEKAWSDDVERIMGVMSTWSVDEWSVFFKGRIYANSFALSKKAAVKREDALVLEKRAEELLIANS